MTKIVIFLFLCFQTYFGCGDIEAKPGPTYSSVTFCHWNLNGFTAHDSIKILLFQACTNQHIIYLSETFLNPPIQTNNDRISIDGYNLIKANHPSNSKRGAVCIYYKGHIQGYDMIFR